MNAFPSWIAPALLACLIGVALYLLHRLGDDGSHGDDATASDRSRTTPGPSRSAHGPDAR
ncbi:hypothetical protein [Streptomyces sp. NPDC003077]|uniref:hypothetical protein n=1 Tax=Streptomyces sp. NPDC003077 TaxID=3154443 RepID=UPI00339ED8CD